jgi:hypothetical protein
MLVAFRRFCAKALLTNAPQRPDTPDVNMPPKTLAKGRYPKRKRAEIDYDVDKSFVDVPDLDDDGYFSEELGEDSIISASSYFPAAAASAPQTNTITVVEVDSEYEDATFGSRKKTKKVCLALRFGPRSSLISVYSARS